MAKCSCSRDSASILKSGGRSPAAGALYDISLRSFTAASRSSLALQHRTLIYVRRSRAGTVARTVLGMAGMQGPEAGNRKLVLGMGAKQGLEAQNRGLVLEMGAKQGLEEGNGEPVLEMGAKQGLEEGNGETVLGMGAKQGLEEGNGETVLGMGAKQGLETGNAANFQEKGRFFGCRAEFDGHFQERGPVLGSWQRCRRGPPTPLPGFCRRWAQCKSCEPSGRARAACIECPALVPAGHGDREEKTEREK